MASEIVVEAVVPCESEVCTLWRGLSDTDWLNRAMGQEPLRVEAASAPGSGARYLVKTQLGGFEVAWNERPYEFEVARALKVRRDLVYGPIRRLDVEYTTEVRGAGSAARVRLTLWPRSAVLAPVVRLSAKVTLGALVRAIEALDDGLVSGGVTPALQPRHPAQREHLERARQRLKDLGGGALGERLADCVATAPDDRVMRLRPYELADEWGADRREVLSVCLLGVRAGLLGLRWELVCPSCRTGAEAVDSLAELSSHGRCQLCDIGFGLTFDRSIEATFRPLEYVRRVEAGPFCIGSPARTPHVVCQALVPPGGAGTLRVPDEAGSYRLFLRGGMTALVQAEAGGAAVAELSDGAWPDRLTVAPGSTLRVTSTRAEERHVKLERSAWTNLAATAADVAALPLFRRDFSAQVLRPGLSLKVQRVALVFSDLVGSTELYAQAGDAEAFRFVQAHFATLGAAIERHGGAVVKTMGDAVMAVFPDERSAVAGARDMLVDFEAFQARDALAGRSALKVGLHDGPGFAATANRALDYFGQTVNVAARLQREAREGQLVLTERVAREAVEAGLLASEQLEDTYVATLKGVAAPLAVVRVQVTGRGATARCPAPQRLRHGPLRQEAAPREARPRTLEAGSRDEVALTVT